LHSGRSQGGLAEPQGRARAGQGRNLEPVPADTVSAKAALDRIAIPQDVLDRISNIAPRSSLIVTDEAFELRDRQRHGFVVLLSGEPQGASRSGDALLREPNSVTRARPTACSIGARLPRFVFPPG